MVGKDPVDLLDPAQAEAFLIGVFREDPSRLRHSQVIAELVRQRARDLNELYPSSQLNELFAFCAGLLHDIGYCEQARSSGFHPLDGYEFLCAHDAKWLAQRIVAHSSSREEAALLGFTLPPFVDDLAAKLVTYWDMQVQQGGEIVGYEARYQDIMRRYGEQSIVGQAHLLARARILALVEEVDRLLKKVPE